MGTLTSSRAGCFTTFLQNSNLVYGNKQSPPRPRPMSLPIPPPYQNPFTTFSSGFPSHQKKYRLVKIQTGAANSDSFTETELDVNIQTASMIVPMEKSNVRRRTQFLSNVDQSLNIPMGVILFFKHNPNFTPDVITRKLEAALSRLLVQYDFLAGRLRWNFQQVRLEIDCNSAGAGFVSASSKLSMADIGDLLCPTPAFEKLFTLNWDSNSPDDQPLFILQVTSFKCGGIALGVAFNHTTLDGTSLQYVLQNLASLAANINIHDDLPFPPYNNRHLLQVAFPRLRPYHNGLMVHAQKTSLGYEYDESILSSHDHDIQPKVLHLSANDIKNLKENALMLLGNNTNVSKYSSGIVTSFNVVTAHVWKCMALTSYNGQDKEKPSVIMFPINVRSRIRPRLPACYTGNGVYCGYGRATYRELEEKPFSYIVEQVAGGVKRMNDEYIRSRSDWNDELGSTYDVALTAWWKLGFNDVEFPWGKPKCTTSAPHQWSKYVILLEDNREVNDKGLNVFVSLPRKELDKFQSLFYQFIDS